MKTRDVMLAELNAALVRAKKVYGSSPHYSYFCRLVETAKGDFPFLCDLHYTVARDGDFK